MACSSIGASNGVTNRRQRTLDAEDMQFTTIALKVKASDADGLDAFHAIDIVITVGDANEAPNFLNRQLGGAAEKSRFLKIKTFADGADHRSLRQIDPDRRRP